MVIATVKTKDVQAGEKHELKIHGTNGLTDWLVCGNPAGCNVHTPDVGDIFCVIWKTTAVTWTFTEVIF